MDVHLQITHRTFKQIHVFTSSLSPSNLSIFIHSLHWSFFPHCSVQQQDFPFTLGFSTGIPSFQLAFQCALYICIDKLLSNTKPRTCNVFTTTTILFTTLQTPPCPWRWGSRKTMPPYGAFTPTSRGVILHFMSCTMTI